MLKALTISDLAIVRQLDLELESGLTVITGETGAGKSILIDALALALGDRADSSLIRGDAERATITAVFEVGGYSRLQALLAEHGLDQDSECILRRVISADGRSRAFCNAAPIPVQLMKQIGELLVDIHGQHAHHSLLRREVQRELLDDYGKLNVQADAVAEAYHHWHELQQEQQRLEAGGTDITTRCELLQFQLDELAALKLSPEELVRLETEHRRLAHATRLVSGCEEAEARVFSGERSAMRTIAQTRASFNELTHIDAGLKPIAELFDQALINLEEAERELGHYRDALDLDPVRMEQLEQRLQALHDIARKHRCDVNELAVIQERLAAELATLVNREARSQALVQALDEARRQYQEVAQQLHAGRVKAVQKMNKEITSHLRELGMPHGKFVVALAAATPTAPSSHGIDDIEYLVTTNPDLAPRPLRKIASGGELSRISLAIQVATASASGIPVLVYDEVDTGIGGRIASVVGEHLRRLASGRQVLCITHLPQVASAGTQHLLLGKTVVNGATVTTVTALDAAARVEEIARMLGGERVSDHARAHARELLAS